jgi:hypothetical protein
VTYYPIRLFSISVPSRSEFLVFGNPTQETQFEVLVLYIIELQTGVLWSSTFHFGPDSDTNCHFCVGMLFCNKSVPI